MIGQTDWRSQAQGTGDNINNFVVQAARDLQLYHETRDSGAFGDLARQKIEGQGANGGNGLYDAGVDITGTGAVWSVTVDSGDEKRWTLLKSPGGEASYGDSNPKEGDYQSYLFMNSFLNEVDSPKFPVVGRMSQQRIKDMIADPKSSVRDHVKIWFAEEIDFRFTYALFMGQDPGLHLTASTSGSDSLGKPLGFGTDPLAAGVDAPPEIVYTATTGAQVTVPAAGPRSNAYRTAYIAAAAALAANGTKLATRRSIEFMMAMAIKNKIKKVKGANWDYDVLCDGAILRDLLTTDSKLMTQMQTAQQGQGLAGQKSLDIRGAVIIDGLRFIPSRGVEKFRIYGNGTSTGVNAGSPVLRYGDGTLDRRNKVFEGADYKIGAAFLLGDGALVELSNGALETYEDIGEDGKGWSVYGFLKQGIRRSFWARRDGENVTATDGWLQQSCIQYLFNINSTEAMV